MQKKINAKRSRAVVVTIALIVAANFAISRAESNFHPSMTVS